MFEQPPVPGEVIPAPESAPQETPSFDEGAFSLLKNDIAFIAANAEAFREAPSPERVERIRAGAALAAEGLRDPGHAGEALRVIKELETASYDADNEELFIAGKKLVMENLAVLGSLVEGKDPIMDLQALEALHFLVVHGSEEEGYASAAVIAEKAAIVARHAEDRHWALKYSPYLEIAVDAGDPAAAGMVRGLLEAPFAEGRSPGAQELGLLARLCDSERASVEDVVRAVLLEQLSRFVDAPERLLDGWWDAAETPGTAVQRNMAALYALAKERPGSPEEGAEAAPQALFRQFGIKNFGRYPLELLMRQYDERMRTDVDYGIALFPHKDRKGGAFFEKGAILQQFSEKLEGRYAFRILEAGDKKEIRSLFRGLEEQYQQHGRKISFALVGGHGTPEGITFGTGSVRKATLRSEDLKGSMFRRANHFFIEHPLIVAISCSTGEAGGFAERMSRQMGAKVIAPTEDSILRAITPRISGDLLDLDVAMESESTPGKPVATAYDRGEPVAA